MKASSKVDALLARQAPAKRVKAMLSLSEPHYDGLRAICRERGIGLSDMVDALVGDLLVRVGHQGQQDKDIRPTHK